jgi:hypothetical protein
MKRIYFTAIAVMTSTLCFYMMPLTPTTLVVGLGHTFEQVARNSSYAVANSSDIPPKDDIGFGATWIKEPAVIIQFDDPTFGFNLAPTTFAAIGYMHNKVDTITTSPMLKKLPFERALTEVARLQKIFQTQGWQLDDDTTWFDLSPSGRAALHAEIRLGRYGYCKWVSLRAPGKYSMMFRMRCAGGCESRIGLDRYLIDISISKDYLANTTQPPTI